MFSPYYAWSRRRGQGEAENFCALNVALYGGGKGRWAMTERGRSRVHRDAQQFSVGPSAMRRVGDALRVDIDEVTVPLPRRLRGSVWIRPEYALDRQVDLDVTGTHRWWPVAPRSRIEVCFERPGLSWDGWGYLDSNEGDGALEDTFTHWNWSRVLADEDALILYDSTTREQHRQRLALRIGRDGRMTEFTPPPDRPLPATRLWRMPRATQADAGHDVAVRKTLEDTPFYSRSVLETHLLGRPALGVHESLSLSRFTHPLVQAMLPFRMPRRG